MMPAREICGSDPPPTGRGREGCQKPEMPTPFPGMDPYLEDPAVWPGLHDSLIVYTRDALQPLILPRYYVEIRERVYFEDPREVIYPDDTVREFRPAASLSGGTAMLVPDEPAVLTIETRQ